MSEHPLAPETTEDDSANDILVNNAVLADKVVILPNLTLPPRPLTPAGPFTPEDAEDDPALFGRVLGDKAVTSPEAMLEELGSGDPATETARIEEARKVALRDGCLVVGFRLKGGGHRNLSFDAQRLPLGMDFSKSEPVTVQWVMKASPAEEQKVQVGWQVNSINGLSMEGRTAADVFLTMKAVVDVAYRKNAQPEVGDHS